MILNFQKRFKRKILAKEKRHTIRAKRKGKRQIRVGDRLDCYIGLRQKGARLLGRWPCVKIDRIWIAEDERICVETSWLTWEECELFAHADGFKDHRDMMQFWKGRLPFHGDMIHWDPDQPQPGPKKGKRK